MQGHPVSEQRLKEVLGHNPLEVGPPSSWQLHVSFTPCLLWQEQRLMITIVIVLITIIIYYLVYAGSVAQITHVEDWD